MLKDSLVWQQITKSIKNNSVISFASAAGIACGKYALPVYEIYKAGFDPYWEKGLNLFADFGLNLSIITHWNNTEGGKEIDTSRCFMGVKRFKHLRKILPGNTTLIGIDEQTALILFFREKLLTVMGKGSVTAIKSSKEINIPAGMFFALETLKSLMPQPVQLSGKQKSKLLFTSHLPRSTYMPLAKAELPEAVKKILNDGETARERQDFARSDRLRKKLRNLGYQIPDSQTGQRLYRIKEKLD